jgi:hypothetical protein|tara:strand:+ start:267 stop:839 length:573 start_codon:yes stop_codon:yes gene_type:complete
MINNTLNAYITKLFNDIQNWAYANSVVINAGGFTIGYSTYYFITGIITLMTPIFILFANYTSKLANIIGLTRTGYLYILIKFISEIIIKIILWLSTILITFILLEYFLNNNILKLKTNIKQGEKKDFIISKAKVENDLNNGIIENKKKIDLLNHKDKIIGDEIVRKEQELVDKLSLNKNKDYEKFIDEIL